MPRASPARTAAVAAGLPHYSTGVPCRRGHDSPRNVLNSSCLACMRERTAAWRAGLRRKAAGREKPDLCECCGNPGTLVFDHDHNTNRFRGWICTPCNLALGHAGDSPGRLRQLAAYLETHHEQTDDARTKLAAALGLRRPGR